MSVPRSVAEILAERVTLELECIDRMYLNLYVLILQREPGVAYFWRQHRGYSFASSALMAPMSRAFVAPIHDFAKRQEVPLLTFERGCQRTDDVAREHFARFSGNEGKLCMGRARTFAICRLTVGQ